MNFISEDFHLHYIASYTLYIQSDFRKDYLVVVNPANEVLVFFHYDNFQPTTEVIKFLSLPFTKVYIGMPHQNLVWVPADVYDDSEKNLYTAYFVDENVDYILSKEIASLDVIALYQYDQLLLNRWKKMFPEAKLVPHFELLLQQAQVHILQSGNTLGVHIGDNQVDIFLFVNGEFKLFNSFEVATPDDLSYFVVSVLKNFSLVDKVDKILLSGAGHDSDWAQRLTNYSNELSVLQSKTKWNTTDAEVEKSLATLNILADTILCV